MSKITENADLLCPTCGGTFNVEKPLAFMHVECKRCPHGVVNYYEDRVKIKGKVLSLKKPK